MDTANRDFVIERLERQLSEKDDELEHIKNTLRESIVREIRSDLKNDLDINNRIIKLEQKMQEIANNLNGVMDELLDQKSMMRSLGHNPATNTNRQDAGSQSQPGEKQDETTQIQPHATTYPLRSAPPQASDAARTREHTEPHTTIATGDREGETILHRSRREWPTHDQNTTPPLQQGSDQTPASPTMPRDRRSKEVHFNIRDVEQDTHYETPTEDMSQTEDDSEYIVAESTEHSGTPIADNNENDNCEYIVADEKNPMRREVEKEFETVEDREDEDTVIITMHKRSSN
ncbi:MAG: hypothetical protein U9N13_06950 [Euryarchaeota archaeon]|nr:hypothetical protein [Euryarchaeota archaeon]